MFIPPNADGTYPKTSLKVWWTIWAFLLADLLGIYSVLGRGPLPPPTPNPFANLVGLVPLFVSIIIRWLVLPRVTERSRGFFMFIVGLALAEGCGIMGIFLGGPYRDSLVVLGALGIAQFMPFFAKQYLVPKPQGFIPNN
ncbi:MAG: hypothetical protein JWQ83_540 [Lacunisphaera sp.]|nr:hypothetical protein [Lacunisphaera sp.]